MLNLSYLCNDETDVIGRQCETVAAERILCSDIDAYLLSIVNIVLPEVTTFYLSPCLDTIITNIVKSRRRGRQTDISRPHLTLASSERITHEDIGCRRPSQIIIHEIFTRRSRPKTTEICRKLDRLTHSSFTQSFRANFAARVCCTHPPTHP